MAMQTNIFAGLGSSYFYPIMAQGENWPAAVVYPAPFSTSANVVSLLNQTKHNL
jgi:hypothetical protein